MKKLKIVTYNTGHGRYNKDYYKGKLLPVKQIINNCLGQKKLMENMNADIILLQETGKTNTKMGNVNHNKFLNIESHNAIYYPNRYIPFLFDFGNSTLIKKKISYTHQKLTSNYLLKGFRHNYFCQNKNSIVVILEKLVIYNVHLIPYNKNEFQRNKQLMNIINDAKKYLKHGKKVIIGGDFNMNLDNLKLDDNDFKLIIPEKNTNRSLSVPYDEKNTIKLDGFIVSNNVEIIKIESLFNFEYSDHSPVYMEVEIR